MAGILSIDHPILRAWQSVWRMIDAQNIQDKWYYKHDIGEIHLLCIETWAYINLAKHVCWTYYILDAFLSS